MKTNKITCIEIFIFISVTLSAQLKVLNNGKIGLRSTTSNYGDIQINIGDGDNVGLCIFKTNWNEPALKIASDEWYTFLTDAKSTPQRGIGFMYGAVCVSEKDYIGEYGGALNIVQTNSNYYPMGLCVTTQSTDGLGIYSQHSSSTVNGTSIYSRVFRGTSLAFASGLGYSNYNFYVKGDGTAYTNGILITSDSTLKTNIRTIENPMQKIMKMRGVSYKYKDISENLINNEEVITNYPVDEKRDSKNRETTKIDIPKLEQSTLKQIADEDANLEHIGFLAQEIEKIIPDVVRTTVNGTKAIAYTDLIAILVEGMKEQQLTIESLNERISFLEKESQPQKSKVNAPNNTMIEANTLTYPVLEQNIPNPFNVSTAISYYLPSTITTAAIYIYDMNGAQLKCYPITEKGKSRLIIRGSEFPAGMYLYALITDGKVIDTKRMILTK
ncbi:MAG: tail fiber domain-containing protein [Paludibacter sp.]|nr:tail fiber domain-containing protein [Paludibacter sp.]